MDSEVFQEKHRIRVQIFDAPTESSDPSFIEPQYMSLEGLPPMSIFKALTRVYMIKVPASFFNNAENKELRMLAGEGVFRFDTYCFFRDVKKWFQWASIFWVKEYFYGSNLRSVDGKSPYTLLMQPFSGINAINMEDDIILSSDPQHREYLHGYGMTPLIKFLLENYNKDLNLLAKIYIELRDRFGRQHPVEAILNQVGTPENIWWPEFHKAYLEGSIWDIPGQTFMEKIDSENKVDFVDENDTLKYLDRSYPDLSARLFQVNLSKNLSASVLGDGDQLNFKLGPKSLNLDYVKILVFSFKDGKVTFLSEGDEVTIDRVKDLIDSGITTLLATVVNSANEYPFLEEMNIELTIKIIKEKVWPWKYVTIEATVTDAIMQSPSMGETSWGNFNYKLNEHLLEASDDGTHFTASWLDHSASYKFEGGIDITVDTVTFEITGFYAWSNMESISDNKVTLSEKHAIRGKEGLSIPVVYWDNDFLSHQVSGEEVCSVIESLTYEYTAYSGESIALQNTLSSYSCDYNAGFPGKHCRSGDRSFFNQFVQNKKQ